MIKFNILAKIRLAFAVVFSTMLLVAIYLFVQLNAISEQTRILYEHPFQVSNTIREMKTEIYLNENLARNIRFTDNDRALDSLKAIIDRKDIFILQSFKIVSRQYLGNKASVDSAIAIYTAWKNSCDKMYQLKKDGKTDSIQFLLKNSIIVKFDSLVYSLNVISGFAENKAKNTLNKIVKAEDNSTRISIIMLLVSCLLVVFFIWYLPQNIVRPIKTFVNEANILLKKEEAPHVIADEQLLLLTLAELKNAYLNIEKQSHEIELKNNRLDVMNNELEDKVDLRTAELILANNELAIEYESSRQLASIVQSSVDAIVSKSLDGIIECWNHAAEKMFGYSAGEAIGENIQMVIPPEYTGEENLIFEKLLNDELIQHYETVRMKKNGEKFPVSLTVSPIKDSEGKITGVSKIIRDITQRVRGEQNLAASETRYRRLFESAKDGILILDAETGMIVDVNPFMTELLGYSHIEYLGKSIWDVGHFKDIVANKENFLELQQKEYIRYEDLPLETSDGQIVHVEFISNVYMVNNQKVIQCNIRDISERYRAEAAKQKWNKQFKQLSANAPGMIFQFTRRADGSFYVPIASEGIRELYGCSPEDVKDDFSPIINVIHPEDAEKLIAEIEDSAKNLTRFNFKFRVQLPGKAMKWLLGVSTPEKTEDGCITWYGFNTDITGSKLTEEKLNNTLQNLERSNKDLEQFAYVANHDLQEPLRMISSFTQLLERRYKDKLDQDANEYIRFAVDGAIRMQKLLNDLLEFSRIKNQAEQYEPVDASVLLGQAVANIQQLLTDNTALVTNDDLPLIQANEAQIIRVFQNLIENAVKFHKKTELPKIHISCTKQENMYRFSVADNGIGIEKQYHDKVFVVFQRLHSVKDYPGTGIGLSICKRIVERHGGTIWFESIVNEGTTFYFTIPA